MDTNPGEHRALLAARIASESGYLLRYARTRVRDEHLAQEAVQETLLAALESIDSYGARARLRTWLTGILLHKIHDLFRRGAREGALPEGDVPEGADALTPERLLHAKRLGEAFVAAIEELPPRQARAFTMREIEGLTGESICRELGISSGNFWVLIHRARSALRASLKLHDA